MTTTVSVCLLLSINLGILWLMMAAPIGRRTITVRRALPEDPARLWQAVRAGGDAGAWSPDIAETHETLGADGAGRIEVVLRHLDRAGRPIRRLLQVVEHQPARDSYVSTACVVSDSALATSFWSEFRDERMIEPTRTGAILTLRQTDHYRGLAFYLYRRLSLHREVGALEAWLRTGERRSRSLFLHPLVQMLLAILSTLLLWPFFGLNPQGLAISIILTVVIVAHELGHMAAYRTFGHQSVHLIFVPMLGGIAVGGRPYRSRFELATCALMGAGMSAFLVPVVILVQSMAGPGDMLPTVVRAPALVFLLVLGSFNLLNLLPMSRFDGGQVLRQVFPGLAMQVFASFTLASIVLLVGYRVGLPAAALVAGLAVFILLSLIGFRAVAMRDELEPMLPGERLMAGFGLYAAVAIHACAIITACDRLFP